MRIGIDGTGFADLDDGNPSGVLNYALAITNHLLEIDSQNEYVIYCRNRTPEEHVQASPRARFHVLRSGNRKALQQFGLPRAAAADRIDLLFFPNNSASLHCPCRSVVTIHDLHPFVVPEQFALVHGAEVHGGSLKSRINKTYWRCMLRLAARKDRVIAPSEATKRDIVDLFRTRPGKIDVVHEGVDVERFRFVGTDDDLREFRARYGLDDPFLLCVGAHAYKNLPGAIRAFATAKKTLAQPLRLVITGSKEAVTGNVCETIREQGVQEHVVLAGFVAHEELKLFYRCAEMLLFPSVYEGFGLPVLEAFACGTPVVASTAGALPEVAGDAALLADPHDSAAIADCIHRLLVDTKLRSEKRRLGLDRANEFTWEKAARSSLDVFQRAVGDEASGH